jgi:hypothetical protein
MSTCTTPCCAFTHIVIVTTTYILAVIMNHTRVTIMMAYTIPRCAFTHIVTVTVIMNHTGSNHDDMASGTNNDRGHTRSARVTRAYHMVINGMCPLLFISFINDIDPFVYRKTL